MDPRLEERYLVVKLKNIDSLQEVSLRHHLTVHGIAPVDCVVIEQDWDIYPKVVDMVLEKPIAPLEVEIHTPWALGIMDQDVLQGLYQALVRMRSRNPTEDEFDKSYNKALHRQADVRWIVDNLPVGTPIKYLGLNGMVVNAHRPNWPEGPAEWTVEFHVASGGKLESLQYTVPQLRAMLEPGYSKDKRDE